MKFYCQKCGAELDTSGKCTQCGAVDTNDLKAALSEVTKNESGSSPRMSAKSETKKSDLGTNARRNAVSEDKPSGQTNTMAVNSSSIEDIRHSLQVIAHDVHSMYTLFLVGIVLGIIAFVVVFAIMSNAI